MTARKTAAKRKPATSKRVAKPELVIVAYKGFNSDWTCRGYQYEVGKTYQHDGDVAACASGFHACEYPLDVFGYYGPAKARYAIVEQSGTLSRRNDDSKIASSKITIKGEIGLPGLIKAAVEYTFSHAKPAEGSSSTGDYGAASSTGDYGAASSTGDYGAASSTGNRGAASSTGDYGAASSTGNRGAASSTGYQGAASSTGYQGAASSTGYQGAASSTGNRGAAMASGHTGRVMGADGNALFLVERDAEYKIVAVWAGIAGRDGIKANTWYTLRDGKPVEVMP